MTYTEKMLSVLLHVYEFLVFKFSFHHNVKIPLSYEQFSSTRKRWAVVSNGELCEGREWAGSITNCWRYNSINFPFIGGMASVTRVIDISIYMILNVNYFTSRKKSSGLSSLKLVQFLTKESHLYVIWIKQHVKYKSSFQWFITSSFLWFLIIKEYVKTYFIHNLLSYIYFYISP